MTCTATVTVTYPSRTEGDVTELVRCAREEQCLGRHFGWLKGFVPHVSVEWENVQSDHTFVVTGAQPGAGTIDFINRPVETS
jgi:hypothetical protein